MQTRPSWLTATQTWCHDFLLIHVAVPAIDEVPKCNMWARIERRPGERHDQKAKDTIRFAHSSTALLGPGDKQIAQTAVQNARLRHVIHILGIVHEMAPTYIWSSVNCWFFADVVIQTLHKAFAGEWLVTPRRRWVERLVKLVGRDTAAYSDTAQLIFRNERDMAARTSASPGVDRTRSTAVRSTISRVHASIVIPTSPGRSCRHMPGLARRLCTTNR